MKRQAGSPDRLLVILTWALLGAAYLIGSYRWLALAMLPVFALTLRYATIRTVSLALLVLLTVVGPSLLLLFVDHLPFIVIKLVGLVLFGLCVWLYKPLRSAQDWARVGRFDRRTFGYLALIVMLAAASLAGWSFVVIPNFHGNRVLAPHIAAPLIFVYMLMFALINSAVEEFKWRGVMLGAFDNAFGAGAFSVWMQALSFGTAHYHGPFLYGWLGVGLTTLFGLLVGLLRRQSCGIVAPWAAHAVADFVILCLVYHFGSGA